MGNFQVDGTDRGGVDFFVEDLAVIRLEDFHLAQAMNYCQAYNLPVGLLINFGSIEPGVQAGL